MPVIFLFNKVALFSNRLKIRILCSCRDCGGCAVKRNIKKSLFFLLKKFLEVKKGSIFALAISNDSNRLEKWQSGRMRQS